MSDITLKIWVVTVVILAVKMWANSAAQVFARFKNKSFVNPEDAKVFGSLLKTEMAVVPEDHPAAQRAAACWRNDLENIPLFMILSLGFVLIGADAFWAKLYFGTFVVARVLHTACYLLMLQPWRTLAYELGAFATLGMVVHMLYWVFM